MSSSDFLRLAAVGLLIGGLGALAAARRPIPTRLWALPLGLVGALGGSLISTALFGSGFPNARTALASLVSFLLVCVWTLYVRERQLPR
ncbi:MAG: hypothetical protein ACRDVE_14715 [Actinocrinis sp.]